MKMNLPEASTPSLKSMLPLIPKGLSVLIFLTPLATILNINEK
jgi:hypothetical protein